MVTYGSCLPSCRALYLPKLDQQQMLEIRSAWFAENAGPPPGNALAAERAGWQEPASSFAISERGKAQAAEELAKQLLARMKSRGCKEEFILDSTLVENGQVDFLPAAAMTAEQLEKQKAVQQGAEQATR